MENEKLNLGIDYVLSTFGCASPEEFRGRFAMPGSIRLVGAALQAARELDRFTNVLLDEYRRASQELHAYSQRVTDPDRMFEEGAPKLLLNLRFGMDHQDRMQAVDRLKDAMDALKAHLDSAGGVAATTSGEAGT